MFAGGAWYCARATLVEVRALRSRPPELTSSVMEASIAQQLTKAVAELKREHRDVLTQLGSLHQATVSHDLDKYGSELRASIDSAISTAHGNTHEKMAAEAATLATTLGSVEAQVKTVHDKLSKLEKRPPPPVPLAHLAPSPAPAPPSVPPPALRRHDGERVADKPKPAADAAFVTVVFKYHPAPPLAANHALLYWLGSRGTETEHQYSDVPAGMEVHELSRPGECWRMRDAVTGNDLLVRYCASAAPRQEVLVGGQTDVLVDFHLPHTQRQAAGQLGVHGLASGLSSAASAVELFEEVAAAAPEEHGKATRVGALGRGSHMVVQTRAGARFRALEVGTGRLIATYAATHEAKQYATVGHGLLVNLEFASPKRASKALAIFHVRNDGEEHLHASLAPQAVLRVPTEAGEQWVVRESDSDKLVLALTASTEPFQLVALPQLEPAHAPPPAAEAVSR